MFKCWFDATYVVHVYISIYISMYSYSLTPVDFNNTQFQHYPSIYTYRSLLKIKRRRKPALRADPVAKAIKKYWNRHEHTGDAAEQRCGPVDSHSVKLQK